MITLLIVGALSAITYQDHQALKQTRADNTAIHQTIDNHEERIAGTETTLLKHRKALDYLHANKTATKPIKIAPTADWMENL